jgi:hypothetical protein
VVLEEPGQRGAGEAAEDVSLGEESHGSNDGVVECWPHGAGSWVQGAANTLFPPVEHSGEIRETKFESGAGKGNELEPGISTGENGENGEGILRCLCSLLFSAEVGRTQRKCEIARRRELGAGRSVPSLFPPVKEQGAGCRT